MADNKGLNSRTVRGTNPLVMNSTNEAVSVSAIDKSSISKGEMVKMAEPLLVGGGGATTVQMAPRIYSPLYEQSNLQLPRDRRTLNSWARFHYETNPWVKNAITLHSTFPISKWNISCSDSKIEQEAIDMFDGIDFTSTILGLSSEMWKIGESFPYGAWDENNKCWSRFIIFNPDYVHVAANVLSSEPILSLQPDDMLKRVVSSNSAADMEIKKQMPREILEYIIKGENIPLSNLFTSHLKLLSSPYDLRGTSIIVAAFKDLMLYDIIREAEFAQASDMINPVTLIKVGDPTGTWRPTQADLKAVQKVWEEGIYNQNYKIITHGAVSVEKIGNSGSIVDTSAKVDRIEKNVLTALLIPMGVVHGEGPTYATASVGLEALKVRYNTFRSQIQNWVEKKVLLQVAKARGWVEHKNGEKKYIVPTVIWNKMNLRDLDSHVQVLMNLLGEGHGTGKISEATALEAIDIDYNDEMKKKKKEAIEYAIFTKETEALQNLTIAEMKNLDEESEIPEKPHPFGDDDGEKKGDGKDEAAAGGGGDDLSSALGLGGGGGGDMGGMEGMMGGGEGADAGAEGGGEPPAAPQETAPPA